MEIDLTQTANSSYFKTLADVVEFQANQQIMLNEPQNCCDDEAMTRFVFAPKTKEAGRLEREHGLSDLVDKRFEELHQEIYGCSFQEYHAV
jgi:hypothetical protein